METPTLIYVGAKRNITALDAASGEVVWELKLPGAFGTYLTLMVEDGVLYAARQGVMYAINALSGEPLWQSEIKGAKNTPMMIATSRGGSTSVQQQQQFHKKQFDTAVAQGAAGGAGAG